MTYNAAQAYQTQQIMTATPAQLVVMLYERALRALRDAERAIAEGDVQARFDHNKRATDIIAHLCSTLDMERGGEIAANLADLYRFMLDRLRRVDLGNDPQPAREVAGLLEPLLASWRELANGNVAAGASNIPGAAPTSTPGQAQPGSGGFALSA